MNDVNTIVIEVRKYRVVFKLFLGDSCGFDAAIGIVILVIVGSKLINKLETLGEGIILPTAIKFIEVISVPLKLGQVKY